jgi:acetolactate synthase-1/2/3 large subunit
MMGYGRGVIGSILSSNSRIFQPKDQPVTETASRITAESFLTRLADRGVEYVLANAGTDFAPIIEALSRNPATNRKYPRVITVPHENVAVAMAHGYYRVSGKPAVVMVHVTVGTANAICGIMNASRDNAPILLGAGRTPVTETGHQASRNRSIHWGQEMFDQGGLTREFVKWDFELRAGQPAESVVDRALDIAMSEPRGPVYLTLPREVLANHAVAPRRETSRSLGASAPAPSRAAIEEAAALIAEAEFPLILTSSAGRAPEAMAALAALADEFALPVVQSEARDISLPTDHAMCLGFDPAPHLGKADVIAVFDSAVPWIPRAHALRHDAKVICLGPDPLFTRYPFREFEGDLLITGESCAAFTMLREALGEATKGRGAAIAARREAIAGLREEMLARRRKLIEQVRTQSPVHPLYLAHCLNKLKSKDAIIVNELGLPVGALDLTVPRTYLGSSLAGGLGFGLGGGLGAKLAAPDREVIAAVGDGSYYFGNPLAFHYVGRAEKLPTLTIIANNHAWHAVRQATRDIYPDGHAAKANVMPLVELDPAPAFEMVAESCGGRGEKVETSDQLMPALRRSFDALRSGTPALLNVTTQNRS